ncbi:hypothetical protein BH09CHL1_BH09CHL1_09320 [soil metagenome]
MKQLHRSLLIVCLLALAVGLTGGQAAFAQASEIPEQFQVDVGILCPPTSVLLPGETLPEGLPSGISRESVTSLPIEGSPTNAVSGVICFSDGSTTQIKQTRPVTILVIEGVLRVQIVDRCGAAGEATPCADQVGTASYFSSAMPGIQQEFGTEEVNLQPGDVAIFVGVTYTISPVAGHVARIMTLGTLGPEHGCHSVCWQFP